MEEKKQKTGFRKGFFMLIGGILGAGFLALPKAVFNVGIIPGIIIIIGLGILILIFHLIIAEISLSLPDKNTLISIAHSVLPKRVAYTVSAIIIGYFLLCLIVYVSLGGGFFSLLLSTISVDIHPIRTTFLFVCIIALVQWNKTKSFAKTNIIIGLILLSCIGGIIFAGLFGENDITLIPTNRSNRPTIYGISLLAMNGMITVPLLYKSTGKSAIKMRSVILSAGFIVPIICLFFCFAILSISGSTTSYDSIHGLAESGMLAGIIGSILGLVAIFSCYTAIGLHLQDVITQDFHLPISTAQALIILIPFIAFLYFNPNILDVLGITGGIIGSILIVLIAYINIRLHSTSQKIKIISMLEYDQIRSWVLIILCIIGIIAQIVAL